MIYLIGMMGCGKTTKGRAAAEALKLPFTISTKSFSVVPE